MTRIKKDTIICSNCGAKFHGLTKCKPTVDGNDLLFVLIEQAADALVTLIRLADSRGNQPKLKTAADAAYTAVLDLGETVDPYAK